MGRRRSLQFLNPLTIIGLAIYIFAASSLGRLPVGGRRELRVVAVLAHILWNEPLGQPQMAGIVKIGGGVLLVRQH